MKIDSGGRTFDLCFMTPTWRGDLDRFALLRESLTAFGHGAVPHYALIDTEDRPLLEALRLPGVRAVTTAELLAPEVEAGRLRYRNARGGRRWKTFQRSLYKRFGMFPDARYYGWQVQQLVKLAAVAQLPHDVFVSFDSDNVVTGSYALEDFVPGGKVALFEAAAERAGPLRENSWYGNACRLLGVEPLPGKDLDYVNQPVVFSRTAMLALFDWLQRRHGRPWYELMLAQPLGAWSEFMLYGTFVREHLKFEGFACRPAHTDALWIYTEDERRNAAALIARAFDDPAIRLLVLQTDDHGHWPLSRFLPILRGHLDKAGHGRTG